MSSKTIPVTISPQGETRIETNGFAGAACQQASEFLEKALGQRHGEKVTPEFLLSQFAETSQRQRN